MFIKSGLPFQFQSVSSSKLILYSDCLRLQRKQSISKQGWLVIFASPITWLILNYFTVRSSLVEPKQAMIIYSIQFLNTSPFKNICLHFYHIDKHNKCLCYSQLVLNLVQELLIKFLIVNLKSFDLIFLFLNRKLL